MKKLSALILLCILQSCNLEQDCGQDCFTPPQSFTFQIVDNESGENLFTNGTYEIEELKIVNVLDRDKTFEFNFITENNVGLIQLNNIGWKTEVVSLSFEVSNTSIFKFKVDAERKTANCCSFTTYKEISVKDANFELDKQTGIYRILVE